MPPRNGRTYGKKKTAIASSAAIFAISPSPSSMKSDSSPPKNAAQVDVPHETLENTDELSLSTPNELAEALSALKIDPSSPSPFPPESEASSAIASLLSLVTTDSLPISLESWDSILPNECTLSKIAEASYAEVYRITTSDATSIVKIMPLKLPSDPHSLGRTFASSIEDVVPELRIMNALTEIPGFVQFKGARIVTGKQSEKFVEAWEIWAGDEEGGKGEEGWNSDFDHPADYESEAKFLAIELGDAGEVLEDVVVDTIERFWDIFIGAVIALARAEAMHEFEHRDLHENNICIFSHQVPDFNYTETHPLFGRSGLEVTIIDYGLSRAILPDDQVTFKDLEADLEIFRGKKWHRQFETYRQMRSHLYTGTAEPLPLTWHKNDQSAIWMSEAGKSWEDYTPLTNILWLSYLLYYLTTQYTKHGPGRKADNKRNLDLIALDLESRLDFGQKRRGEDDVEEDVRFWSAGECLDYCVERGWVSEEQLGGEIWDEEEEEQMLEMQLNGGKVGAGTKEGSSGHAIATHAKATPWIPKSRTGRRRFSQSPKKQVEITPTQTLPPTPSTNGRTLRPRPTPSASSSPTKTTGEVSSRDITLETQAQSRTRNRAAGSARVKKNSVEQETMVRVEIPAKKPNKTYSQRNANLEEPTGEKVVTEGDTKKGREEIQETKVRSTRGRKKKAVDGDNRS